MPISNEELTRLVEKPSESLSVELKDWIDPDDDNGKTKVIKSLLAMRNNNGGFLLIGFRDSDGSPNFNDAPPDVREKFHLDKIQGWVTKFSSDAFEIYVHFPHIEMRDFVVIEVPQGLRTPAITKSEIRNGNDWKVRADRIYVRTLTSNNTPSTAEAGWKDFPSLMERCFENREADVGRFIRRHLSGIEFEALKNFFRAAESNDISPSRTQMDEASSFLDESYARYELVVRDKNVKVPPHGSMEVAVTINGKIKHFSANQTFLDLLNSNNPRYTGWPTWIDSRFFADEAGQPFVINKTWEALIASFGNGFYDHLDYWRLSPFGKFYLYRALQDDIGGGDRAPESGTELDFGLAILRAAESMAVSLVFAKCMREDESASISLVYRWKGLKGRRLSAWANPARMLRARASAKDDEAISRLNVPTDIAITSIASYVNSAIAPLFEVFDGFEISPSVVEDLVTRLIERRL